MAIHSTSRPALQGRVLVRIPATFTATGGLAVSKANGVWTLEPDWSGLTELATLLEPDSKDLWVWDPVTEVYNTMSIAALGASLFVGTSVTSNTIGTGAFTFATQAGKLWPVGGTLVISSDADPTVDYMVAQVTSYSAAGSLVVNVATGGNHGSGAHTDWTISLAGERGETGTAATIAAGTTTTLAEGSSATAANSGTSAAAVFDFGIPRGATPAIGYTFSTTTADADPGAGIVRFNNATPASVTEIYFDNADADANTVTAWLDSFDDSTNAAKGTLTFTDVTTPATKMIFTVSGSVVDGTGYRKVTVAHVSGATLFTNARRLAVQFSRTGDDGGGVSGATNHGVVIATGATTATSTAALTDGQIVVGQTGADPLPKTLSGDGTLSAAGALSVSTVTATTTNDNAAAGKVGEYVFSGTPTGGALNSTVTISNASPGVVTWTGHVLLANSPVYFTTTGGLPTGLSINTTYYVVGSSITANTFTVSATIGGAAINTSSAGSGTHTARNSAFLATGIDTNVTSISLTAGDWDVTAMPIFTGGTTTEVLYALASVSTTSVTLDQTGGRGSIVPKLATPFSNGGGLITPIPSARFSLSGTTTIYMVVNASFNTSTMTAHGNIHARRVR